MIERLRGAFGDLLIHDRVVDHANRRARQARMLGEIVGDAGRNGDDRHRPSGSIAG